MREGNVPSILDYVLMDEDHSHQIQKMLIDDDGAGLADATDHSWITTELVVDSSLSNTNTLPKEAWRIRPNTNW